ncbi:NADH dehydrogenase [ubiquinone] 1 beta subcomplex subunit 7 [Oenanthe melanoleuca]|uniref:NADH dehydrogenase [ubiquinone] 1 beta subcomplex subunit 7 n=1 Tax=Oenanthe melanoleuca TaxID=2939378 RepID=UPI0024C138E5|nr:NADH dehydrogenase [ubiquinone] 1 beta subcomplex subunit 7 [Oenanthe melanoleuca]
MGAHLARRYLWDAEGEPDPLHMPSFPAELGLPRRQPRAAVASAAQLAQGRVPLEQRDYCSHHLLRLLRCHRDNFPVPWGCHRLRHAWDACQHEDYVMRMKEFERERRLLQRQKRLRQSQGDTE